jgi:AraC-like DNA-binding protein
MIGSGTTTYTDPDAFRVSVPGATANLVVTSPGPFRARLTWINMRRLRLILVDTIGPQIAFISLAPGPAFVSFPLRSDSPVVWNGVPMRNGMLLFHGRRDRFHQRSAGTSRWALIAVARDDLAAHARTLLGAEPAWPQTTKFLRPPFSRFADIRRLHNQACGLARTRPDLLAHREVTRALEQDLLHAMVNALAGPEVCDGAASRQRDAAIMARFEKVLAAQSHRQLSLAELCTGAGVPERTLRLCCEEFLGLSPTAYVRLRRLNLVRAALLRSDPRIATVSSVARQNGFSELGRFAVAYRVAFGESPSTTLHGRSPKVGTSNLSARDQDQARRPRNDAIWEA